MPELPEVEVITQQLKPILEGCTVKQANILFPTLRYAIELPLTPCKIERIERRSKYILVYSTHLNTQNIKIQQVAIWHLGMTGQFRIFNTLENNDTEQSQNHAHFSYNAVSTPQKHDHAELWLNNNYCIRYNDARRFGCLLVHTLTPEQPLNTHSLLKNLGLEPLATSTQALAKHWHQLATGETLCKNKTKAQTTKTIKPIKQALKIMLMDNRYVVGIGNIYASEICFKSGILPTKPAHLLTAKQWLSIATHSQNILQQAILQGGSTLRDFVNINGQSGYFQQTHQVYQKDGQACPRCLQTKQNSKNKPNPLIAKINQAGRSTFFCAVCQH